MGCLLGHVCQINADDGLVADTAGNRRNVSMSVPLASNRSYFCSGRRYSNAVSLGKLAGLADRPMPE